MDPKITEEIKEQEDALDQSIALNKITVMLLDERKKELKKVWVFFFVVCVAFVALFSVFAYTTHKEKQDCLKDGIVVEDACSSFIYGTTPSGKSFMISSNDGYTERSWHCYSVRINGNTIFTSGEFWRAYNAVKFN